MISHQHFQKTSASSAAYHPGFGVKQGSGQQQQQSLGGTIHAPRHSQTKRSFGRDLINIQQPQSESINLNGIKNTIFNVAKVTSIAF
jgi:hypothetical protein